MYYNKRIIESFRQSNSKSRKNKRAVLGFIGEIHAAVYGLATDDDIRKVNRNINNLIQKSVTQDELNKQQISIIKNALSSEKKMIDTFRGKINDLNKQYLQTTHTVYQNDYQMTLHDSINYLIQTCTLLIIEQDNISDLIIRILSDKISIPNYLREVLDENEFRENLREIKYGLNAGQELPFDVDTDNIYNIFKIIQVSSQLIYSPFTEY